MMNRPPRHSVLIPLPSEGYDNASSKRDYRRCLQRKKRQNYTRKLDGDAEAHLIAIACSQPPKGHNRWTLRLLADRMVELAEIEMSVLSRQCLAERMDNTERLESKATA